MRPVRAALAAVLPRRPAARLALAVGLAAAASLWGWTAHALWHSTVPPGLALPHVDPSTLFSRSFL